MEDCATKFDFQVALADIKSLKKDYHGFIGVEEFAKRLNVIHTDLEGLIRERPTHKQVKQTLQALEDRYDGLSKTVKGQVEVVLATQDKFNKELEAYE